MYGIESIFSGHLDHGDETFNFALHLALPCINLCFFLLNNSSS